ncbi:MULTISPECIES: ATP-dependent Clp protease proteolytic subunit, partial [Citrobacter]|uniref:ATP-dependent Clp protease proteolytic subunit n=1 Tax=Citrobacter TaxID=544 RepID=UPI001F2ACC1F
MQQMISPPRRGTMINPRASVAGIDAANGQCWYEIRALAAGRVEIFLYDVIGGWGITAQQFVSECKEAGVFEASAVDLHIHSPGGDVMQGFAIFNTLSRLKAKLDIWVDGVAASMASMIVCLPGATVHMPETAHRVGLESLASLRKVRAGAEYKYVTIKDRGEPIALATYGELFSIDRQTIINDDLDMLTR